MNQYGIINPKLDCPHCNTTGQVRTKQVERTKGISGGKATAALMTSGVSILATGINRKENMTQCFCENCRSKWDF